MDIFAAIAAITCASMVMQASGGPILVQAQGIQNEALYPGFWSIRNDSCLDLVRVDLDLPGPSFDFDSTYVIEPHTVVGANPNNISFSYPGDNGDNVRVDFVPGSFLNGAEVSFYAIVLNWVSDAHDMVGIAVTLTFADGSIVSDTFRHVDPDPFTDFGPEGSGCAFSSGPDTDGDGTPDCSDLCPSDPDKVEPGVCGCGVPDLDQTNNGLIDCVQHCLGDVTGDDLVGLDDLNLLLFNFGTPGPLGDLDNSGLVDLADLNSLLFDFGCVP